LLHESQPARGSHWPRAAAGTGAGSV
jgi:hypothetical protein